MPFDETLAVRVRQLLARRTGVVEKKMFGGLGFFVGGNMCVGVWKEFLIARVGPDNYETCLAQPHTRVFDITGRVMKGWVMVEPAGLATPGDVKSWTDRSYAFARELPPK